MFDLDNWAEIFNTIKKNRMRTFLTGFSISWGIFMFCVLLASGFGLRNGMRSSFKDRSDNSLQYWGRTTSKPYKGFPDNRPISLDHRDLTLIRGEVPEADKLSGMISTNITASYGTRSISCSFQGVDIDYKAISSGIRIIGDHGRFINEIDIKEKRKVAVINERLRDVLFNNEDPVGKLFIAGNLAYHVIGVYNENTWDDQAKAYIPVSTAQLLYRNGHGYDDVAFTLKGLSTKKENEAFEKSFRGKLSVLHFFDPADERPVGIWNQLQNYLEFLGIFNGITAFIWIIGVGTLIAGIIGVSNIMLITVRERTREFGIRKALGAKPSSILGNIIMESVFITSLFGYIGMFLGVGLGEVANTILQSPEMKEATKMFNNPTIDVNIAMGAMLILVFSGVLAGYFPALKAVKVSAVEAMRTE